MALLDDALPYVPAINARELSIRALAKKLKTNESYLSRVLSGHLERVESSSEKRKKAAELAKYRAFLREKHAKLVKSGQESLKKAAFHCKCSERTLRRYISRL